MPAIPEGGGKLRGLCAHANENTDVCCCSNDCYCRVEGACRARHERLNEAERRALERKVWAETLAVEIQKTEAYLATLGMGDDWAVSVSLDAGLSLVFQQVGGQWRLLLSVWESGLEPLASASSAQQLAAVRALPALREQILKMVADSLAIVERTAVALLRDFRGEVSGELLRPPREVDCSEGNRG